MEVNAAWSKLATYGLRSIKWNGTCNGTSQYKIPFVAIGRTMVFRIFTAQKHVRPRYTIHLCPKNGFAKVHTELVTGWSWTRRYMLWASALPACNCSANCAWFMLSHARRCKKTNLNTITTPRSACYMFARKYLCTHKGCTSRDAIVARGESRAPISSLLCN